MIVRIIVYANKEWFTAKLVSGDYSKKIGGPLNKGTLMKNTLIGLIKAIKKIKYPVDLEVISNKKSINQIVSDGIEPYKKQGYVYENIEEWIELLRLIKSHKSFKYFYHKETENNLKEFQSLYLDCINKRYKNEI